MNNEDLRSLFLGWPQQALYARCDDDGWLVDGKQRFISPCTMSNQSVVFACSCPRSGSFSTIAGGIEVDLYSTRLFRGKQSFPAAGGPATNSAFCS